MRAISTSSIHEKAYAELKNAIMSAFFTPGEVLVVRTLSERLGTSPMPVREALRQLVAERAVEVLPNRSTRIPKLDVKRMKEIIQLRLLLEGLAAAEAATHCDAEDLEIIEREHEAAGVALAAGDLPAYLAHNAALHFAVYRASGNETLLPLIESLWLQFAPTFIGSLRKIAENGTQLQSVASDHHSEILAALRARDPKRARKAIEDDISDPTHTPGFWDMVGI